MTDYDELAAATAPDVFIFTDKSALDPLAEPDRIVAREPQQQELARLLQGVNEDYLPTTISAYGRLGTGKKLTTRRLCRAFAERTDAFAFEYVEPQGVSDAVQRGERDPDDRDTPAARGWRRLPNLRILHHLLQAVERRRYR